MNEIKLNSGIVVKVNDNGDTIVIDVDDANFVDKFLAVYGKIGTIAADMGAISTEGKTEREQLGIVIEKTKIIMADIDDLFGKDACLKVFGDIVPMPYLLAEFFEQLTPILDKYMDSRQKKIASKYSGNRKGNRSKYRTKEEIIQDAMR